MARVSKYRRRFSLIGLTLAETEAMVLLLCFCFGERQQLQDFKQITARLGLSLSAQGGERLTKRLF